MANPIALRTEDLCELLERERRARRRLASLSATKDAVLAIVADETRATLSCVADWMRLLGTQPFDAHTREYAFAAIERAARKELELLDDMLDLGRADGGSISPLVLGEVDIDAVVESAVDVASRNDSGVEIACAGLGGGSALIVGDKRRLARAVERLLAMCVRYTRRGGTVNVALRKEPRAWSVRVEVPARGDLALEADPDSCVDLALARAVISAHRGSFDGIEDGIRGTRVFVVSLPAVADVDAAPPPPLDGVRILVIDDDDDCRALLGEIARANGATALVVADAPTAAQAMVTFTPDVVLCGLESEDVRSAAGASAFVPVRKASPASGDRRCEDVTLELPFTSPRVVRTVTDAMDALRARASEPR